MIETLLKQPWFQRLLGIPPEVTRNISRAHPGFATPWPLYAAAAVLLFTAIWTGINYWRDGTKPTWWTKGPLSILRVLAVAALLLILAQPFLRLSHAEDIRPNVVLLVDTSDSMARPDPRLPSSRAAIEAQAAGVGTEVVGGMTRLDRVNSFLNRSGVMRDLSKRYNVRVLEFASKSHAVELPSDPVKLAAYRLNLKSDPKTAATTQMGDALRRPVDELAGQPLAGALVLSDGGSNLGEDPILAADGAKQAGLRISTVGVGDPTKTKDIALLSVLADDTVRVNNTVTVYVALAQRGYAGKTIAVTLKRGNDVVGRETVRLGPDDQKQEVHFNYVPAQGGRFTYTVSTDVLSGELTATNNRSSFLQTVISKRLKVLYVEGEPRYEYRYLHNAILRDTSLDFACLLLSGDTVNSGGEGNISVQGFPATEKELFEYDIIALGDVPRSYFSDAQLVMLRRFVEDRGASLLVIAGEQHMPHEYAGTPLEAVLPVAISSSPDPINSDQPFEWQLTPEGRLNPVMQLEDTSTVNDRTWSTLPGMFWAAGVQRAKPGATVLAVHPTRRNADGPYPLVAFQPFGAGKCYTQLVDSTWRWRWRVGDRYFYRYWGQVFRTLTPKELPGNSRFVQLNADRGKYLLGERVQLTARLLDDYYHPVKAANATAILKPENGPEQKITLNATPGAPGLFSAQLQPDRIGKFEVSMTSPTKHEAKAGTAFLVETQALERQRPELDETLLKRVAAAGGGKYYQATEIAAWAKSLPNNKLVVRSEQEIDLWNHTFFLMLFVVPLALEWLVRKRKGLL
jgi:hypothetical protein